MLRILKVALSPADPYQMNTTRKQLMEWGAELEIQQLVHGPTDLARACLIARHGILPANETQQIGLERAWAGIQTSRDGYVYLGTPQYIAGTMDGVEPLFAVALAEIDPKRLACDEDHVSIYTTRQQWDPDTQSLADALPESFRLQPRPGMLAGDGVVIWQRTGPLGRPLTRGEHKRNRITQGDWANRPRNAAALARPEFVRMSLVCGSVAHRGAIKPSQLTLCPDWWQRTVVYGQWAGNWTYTELLSLAATACLTQSKIDRQRAMIEQIIVASKLLDCNGATLAHRLRAMVGCPAQVELAIDEVEHDLHGHSLAA